MRRILLILVLLILVGGGIFVYRQYRTKGASPATTLRELFPIGRDTNNNENTFTGQNQPAQQNNTTDGIEGTLNTQGRFTRISPEPIAGYSSFYTPSTQIIPRDPNDPKSKDIVKTTQQHTIRYVARKTGYVYEYTKGELPLQISNIYIPNVYEASFLDNNQTALLRFLREDVRTIATFAVPIPPQNSDGTRTQKDGVFLPDNILSFAIAPDQKSLARLTYKGSLGSITKTTSADTKPVEVFSSPLKELAISWPVSTKVFVQTKPSYTTPGFFYEITGTKQLKRVLGDIYGLTTSVSPDGSYILYSQSAGKTFSAKLFSTKDGITKPVSLAILPEKCAWFKNNDLLCAGTTTPPEGSYPDDWYMGVIHFSDQLYHIYTSGGIYDVLYPDTDEHFDMVNLSIDETTNTLYFIDKKTGYLYATQY